jgi:hypothetical protein
MSEDPEFKLVYPDTEPAEPIPKPDVLFDIAALRVPQTLLQPHAAQHVTVRIAEYHVTPADDGLCVACDEQGFHAVRRFRAADGEARRDALHALLSELVAHVITNDEREAAGQCPLYYPSDEDEEDDND